MVFTQHAMILPFAFLLAIHLSDGAGFFGWWGSSEDSTQGPSRVRDGVPLISVPFEVQTADDKFLQEAAKYTSMKLSELDTCQHRVVMKIRGSCSSISEEELAKMSVNLLNCQSKVEGRQVFPCTETMELRACTSAMDSDTWNAYHLMNNRARAVCYAARHQQFRALSEMTVNKLMSSAHDQLAAMAILKEGQHKLESMTSNTLETVTEGHKTLTQQQERLRSTQQTLQEFVSMNLRSLTREKALIAAGHSELARMTTDMKERLDAAGQQLEAQAAERQDNHRQLVEDLETIQRQAQLIWERIDVSTTEILAQHAAAAAQYEETLVKLSRINDTVNFLLKLVDRTRVELDIRLAWITSFMGGTGDKLERLYSCLLHGLYLVLGMVAASFLQAPRLTRACLLLIVVLNLTVSFNQGPDAALDFSAMTTIIVASTVEHTFKNLMQQHVDQAFTKGFDDNTGRHVAPASFEMCSPRVWHAVASLAFGLFLREDAAAAGGTKLAPLLRGLLHTDVNFSEARCGKVLPLATATYQENLPAHYTRDFHESKLALALSVLGMHARGPSYRQSRRRLERECDKLWRNSRQMCEVLSLTGNPCTAPLHRGGGEGAGGGVLQTEDEVDQSLLPVSEHSSGVRYVAACNCGRKQGPREDPFTVRAANHEFYRKLAEDCVCKQLEDIHFPVFQPSTKDYKAAQLFKDCARGDTPRRDPASRKDPTSARKESLPKSPECRDLPTPLGNTQPYSLAGFVSGQSVGSDLLQEEATSRLSPSRLSPSRLSPGRQRDGSPDGNEGNDILMHVSDLESESSKDKSLIRQPSTTEYLPGMLHDDSPLGLLPEFPSWSLVCLGPSSLYSHNLGLQDQQQAGFLGGSAHLLPWDVTVRLQHHKERCWPAVGDQLYNSRSKTHLGAGHAVLGVRGRKPKIPLKDVSECVIKIFVGVEYECPRGHRFMCSAPDKVLKAVGPAPLKEGGGRVTANDMPLYCPCPCRSAKPLIGQLMRVHIVTPKAPVFVTLNPRVQPAPHQCPVFVTGSDQPLTLSQSAYWVLRLPYVYMGDHGPYVAPKDPVPPGYGRLLAGMYRISELPAQD